MASGVYNRGKLLLATTCPWVSGSDIRVLLTTSSYTPNVDHNTVADVTNELSGGGYVRKTLANKTSTENDTADRAQFDADDVTWSALGAAAGTPAYAVVYQYNAADASAGLLGWVEFTSPPTPNGGDWTAVWDAVGLFTLS